MGSGNSSDVSSVSPLAAILGIIKRGKARLAESLRLLCEAAADEPRA